MYITERKKNLIITCGRNVYPEQVKSIMSDSGLVRECRVHSIPSETSGETVVADVVLAGNAKVERVKEFCLNNLPAYKVPTQFFAVSEIEKSCE